jgi:hypothetical protein
LKQLVSLVDLYGAKRFVNPLRGERGRCCPFDSVIADITDLSGRRNELQTSFP